MNEESKSKKQRLLLNLGQLAKTLSIVAIPIVLAAGGWMIQRSISEQSVNKDYVQLAVSILARSDEEVATPLREWAVKLLNDKPGVKFDDEMKLGLTEGRIGLPGRSYTSSGFRYDKQFVDGLFSEWNPDSDISEDRKIVWAFFAEIFLEKRWLEITRFFDAKYVEEQLINFLGGGADGERGAMGTIQFIQEALVVVEASGGYEARNSFDLERVTKIRFLDIVDSDWGEEYAEIRFRLIQDDGATLDTGYVFIRKTLFFVGAVG